MVAITRSNLLWATKAALRKIAMRSAKVPRPLRPLQYRPTCLLSCTSKTLDHVLLSHIRPDIDRHMTAASIGFRPGRQCAEINATLNMVVARVQEYGKSLVIAKIDANKAFNRTRLDKVWIALEHIAADIPDVDERAAFLVASACSLREHADGTAEVWTDGHFVGQIANKYGLHQGQGSSPALFAACLDHHVWRAFDEEAMLRGWGALDEHAGRMPRLTWADDNVILAESPYGACRDVGLHRLSHYRSRLLHLMGRPCMLPPTPPPRARIRATRQLPSWGRLATTPRPTKSSEPSTLTEATTQRWTLEYRRHGLFLKASRYPEV